MSKRKNDLPAPDFEQSLAELEEIVHALEHDTLTLEQMISRYERGTLLMNACDKTLQSARQRLEKLALREDNDENALAYDDDSCHDSSTATPHTDYDDDTISLF